MASNALLMALANPTTANVFEAFERGQERALRLDEVLRSNAARQLVPGAMNKQPGALAQILGLVPEMGIEISRQLEGQADRDEDRAWRRDEAGRAQRNSDRAFDLQRQGFNADENWRRTQADLEQQKLLNAGPDLVEMYDDPSGQPYKARWNPRTQTFDRVGGIKAPSGGNQLSVTLPDGTVINQGAGKLTEMDSKGATYATRAAGALPLIDQYGDALLSFGENVAGRAPLIGNYMKSPAYQQAQQAGDEFLQAILRKDTGAAITKEEKGEYGIVYLPQPGDSPQVLQQKRVSRKRAYEALRAGMSPNAILAQEQALRRTQDATGNQGGKGDMNQGQRRTTSGVTYSIEQ